MTASCAFNPQSGQKRAGTIPIFLGCLPMACKAKIDSFTAIYSVEARESMKDTSHPHLWWNSQTPEKSNTQLANSDYICLVPRLLPTTHSHREENLAKKKLSLINQPPACVLEKEEPTRTLPLKERKKEVVYLPRFGIHVYVCSLWLDDDSRCVLSPTTVS